MLFLVNVLVPKTKWPTREDNSVVEIKKGRVCNVILLVNLIRLAVLVKVFDTRFEPAII